MALRMNDPLRSKIVQDAVLGGLGTAILRIFGGSQPTLGGGYTTAGTIVTISGILWNNATNGTSLLASTYVGTSGTVAGTATWARLSDTSGTGCVIDGACGTSSLGEFVIDTEAIAATSAVTLTSATIIQPAS